MHDEAIQASSDESLDSLYEKTREIIRKGSKSFTLGSLFFTKETQRGAYLLYSWCRHCDDAVDDVDHRKDLTIDERSELKRVKVKELKEKTLSVYRGEPQTELPFVSFQKLEETYQIPKHYPLELIEGMAMDIENIEYETLEDLELYCYRVASVVGLMMCHIMGVSDPKALRYASMMGMAMQMTNICRDLKEDGQMNRIYVPKSWQAKVGLKNQDILEQKHSEVAHDLVRRLVEEAGMRYHYGRRGIKYLPPRAGWAIYVASYVYEAIGWLVVNRGANAWETRPVVSNFQKIIEVLRGTFLWGLNLVSRVFSPFKPNSFSSIEKFRSFTKVKSHIH